MKIIYIHQHFIARMGSGGARSYDVAAHLVKMGHEVTLIAGQYDRSGLEPMPRGQRFRVHHFEGFKVVACNVPDSNKQTIPGRIWSIFAFSILGTIAAIRERGGDIVFASSLPLEVCIPGFFASQWRRIPMVYEVRDLWPEDVVDAGRIKRGGLGHRLMQVVEWFAYRVSARIFLVSRGFHDRLLQRGYPDRLLRTIVLGGDGDLYTTFDPNRAYLQDLGLGGKFVAVYAGAHGTANGLIQLLDAAALLLDRPDIAILLIGDGKERQKLLDVVRDRKLTNVHMQPFVSKLQVPGILQACDLGLLILTQVCRPRWVTPNKIFDYMFAGLPTIVNFAGTSAEMVEREKTGVAPSPGDAQALADAIRYYADHRDQRDADGERARRTARQRYDRGAVAAQLAAEFQAVLDEYRPRGMTRSNRAACCAATTPSTQ